MGIGELIYPDRCQICAASLPKGGVLCDDCLKHEEYYLYKPFKTEHIYDADSPLVYRDFIRQALHMYKFNGKRYYADWFAQLTAECVKSKMDIWKPDIITYVPISFGRWFKRGYNQSALVARLVAKKVNLPCKCMLRKKAFVKTQSSIKDHEKRAENVNGAFLVRNNINLQGKRILIIDDVITTGSTISSCGKALRNAGASAVFAVSMTKTPVK